jgi:hypothetical protein
MRLCLILRDGKAARTRIDTKTTGAFRGTDGSNPVPSSGESGANSTPQMGGDNRILALEVER